jgi:NhaP-type Na+/H+ and K+/H+ antiporter
VLYLLIGLLLGESVIGIEFEDAELARSLAYAALVVILAEGGLTTRMSAFRPVAAIGISLATVGVAVSTVVMAPSSRCCAECRCGHVCPGPWRSSPASTTHPPSSS